MRIRASSVRFLFTSLPLNGAICARSNIVAESARHYRDATVGTLEDPIIAGGANRPFRAL